MNELTHFTKTLVEQGYDLSIIQNNSDRVGSESCSSSNKGKQQCQICMKQYKDQKKHYKYKCMLMPQVCIFCEQTFEKRFMDTHVYKECLEFIVQCRGGCEGFYKRRYTETHQCVPKEDNSMIILQDRIKDLKNVNNKLELEQTSMQGQIRQYQDKKQEYELEIIKLTKQNHELMRRLETQMLGQQQTQNILTQQHTQSHMQLGNPQFIEENQQLDQESLEDDLKYEERMAYSLEHYGRITQLILLDPTDIDWLKQTGRFYFATSDVLGCVKVWDLDVNEKSQHTFMFQEEIYNNFNVSNPPPPIRFMLQLNNLLVCALGHDFAPGMIQFWDLGTKEDLFLIQQAHQREIRALTSLHKRFIVSGGIDREIKVWDSLSFMIVQVIQLPGGERDLVTTMITYGKEYENLNSVYKDHIMVFTEMSHFYVYKIDIEVQDPNSSEALLDELQQLANQQQISEVHSQEDDIPMNEINTVIPQFTCQFQLVKTYKSKHFAHTLIELNQEGGLLTISHDNLEFWNFVQKKKNIIGTSYGQIQHCCKLFDKKIQNPYANTFNSNPINEQDNQINQIADDQNVHSSTNFIYQVRLLTSEDSRILRIWNNKQILKNRVVTRHNDVIVKLLKIPGKPMFLSASADGAIKCFIGKKTDMITCRDLVMMQ